MCVCTTGGNSFFSSKILFFFSPKNAANLFCKVGIPVLAGSEEFSSVSPLLTDCRPQGNAWLRVVLEKPFGHDSGSAKELSSALKEHLKEEELYRIDHYLGKTGNDDLEKSTVAK